MRTVGHGSPERMGRRLGNACKRVLRIHAAFTGFLQRVGFTAGIAQVVAIGTWVLAVAALGHAFLWAAALGVVVLWLVSGPIDIPNSVRRENEWRMGYMGFGLYSSDGLRIDLHDPDSNN